MPGIHVLLVDDDSDESYLFNEAIEHAGLNIRLSRADNGNHLISFLQNNPAPDLIFIDINMPYKDGMEALIEIRSKPEFEKLPLIIYSTTKNEVSIDACYENGANLFVIKPDNFDDMVRVVKKVCTVDWKSSPDFLRKDFVVSAEMV